jgi:hypothetical protein
LEKGNGATGPPATGPPPLPRSPPPMVQPVPTPEPPPLAQEPPSPPILLSNKDKSTKKEEELFGISIDVDSKELREKLSPPGTAEERAIQLTECLVDAVSLPGKIHTSGDGDDVGANIHAAMAELVATKNQLLGSGEDMRKDLKWKNQNRQVLKSIKNADQLTESLRDVVEIRDRTLRNSTASQRTILSKEPWNTLLIEAWSLGGYYSVISQRSIDHYISLLQHLVLVAAKHGWDEAQREIDFYTKEWALIRSQCLTRLTAMCRIYVSLRDGADAKWLSPTMEAEKVAALCVAMAELKANGTRGGGGGGNSGYGLCEKCGTLLHGRNSCPFQHLGAAAAKKKGRDMLKKLALTGEAEAAEPDG